MCALLDSELDTCLGALGVTAWPTRPPSVLPGAALCRPGGCSLVAFAVSWDGFGVPSCILAASASFQLVHA